MTNQCPPDLHKPIIKKFEKHKAYSFLKDNIWGAYLADMQLISTYKNEFRFLSCVIYIFSKYAKIVPLKYKKGIIISKSFQIILDECNRKPNEIGVDKGGDFYNRSMKSWLQNNDVEIFLTHNEGKSVVLKDSQKIKNNVYKYMTSISKTVYIGKFDDTVNEYNNTDHKTIKIRPADIKSRTDINFNLENNDKYPKFEVGDPVRISKHK